METAVEVSYDLARLMWIGDYLISGTQLAFVLLTFVALCATSSNKQTSGEIRDRNILNRIVTFLSVSLGAAHVGVGIVVLNGRSGSRDDANITIVLLVLRGFAWIVLGSTLRLQRRNSFYLRTILQIWYIFTFLAATFDATTAAVDLVRNEARISLGIALAFMSWPVGALLLYSATEDFNAAPERQLSDPLLSERKGASSIAGNSESRDQKGGSDSLISGAGFFSRLTFAWLNPLLSLGRERVLQREDVPDLSREDRAAENYDLFVRTFGRQKSTGRKDEEKSSSIFWVFASCYRGEFCLTGFCALVKSVTISLGPIFVFLLMDYSAGIRLFKYEGLALVAGLLLAKLAEVVSQRHWNFGDRRVGIEIRSALSAAIYQKATRLSAAGKQRHTAGEITNYIAVDAFKVGEFPYWMHMLWATPLQIVLVSSILFVSVGFWGTFVALVVIVLTGLASGQLARKQQRRIAAFTHYQDARMRAIIETLRNIKILKLQAWEERFLEKIDNARWKEMNARKLCWESKNHTITIFWAAPVIVPVVTFLTCIFVGTPLNARNIFSAFACIRIIGLPMSYVPDAIAAMIQMRVSLGRIQEFLDADEVQEHAVIKEPAATDSAVAVEIVYGVFSWDSNFSSPTLREICLEVGNGQTVAVCGQVGSGKSSLLCAVLGEIPKGSGNVRVVGSVAYVAQSAWIQSGTVRSNILFGKPMDNSLYKQVLDACALSRDLESMAFGDMSEIGERGLNLSGGQKQRLQIARALYQDADIYLLDDPFSAVDAHTSSSLFKDCILRFLAKKTVILVTHQVEFLHSVDQIILLRDGMIREAGKFEELARSGNMFQRLITAHEDFTTSGEIRQQTAGDKKQKGAELELNLSYSARDRPTGLGQLTKDEEKERASPNIQGYISYWKTANSWFWLGLALSLYVIYLALTVGTSWWLASQIDKPGVDVAHVIVKYSSLVVFSTLLIHFRGMVCNQVTWAGSLAHFEKLKTSVFHAPMTFFDSTPGGRILTRFSTDMNLLDDEAPHTALYTVFALMSVTTTALVTGLGAWQMLLFVLPMFACSFKLMQHYLATANPLMRIYGTTRSPLLNHSAETIAGAVSIRAFEVEDQFMRKNLELIDINSSPYFHSVAANEWLALRIEMLSALVLCASAFLVSTFSVSPAFVGLALSYGLTINYTLFIYVNTHCRAANNLISVERIRQYMNIPSEAPPIILGSRPPVHWPTKGKVEFRSLKVRYQPEMPLVLHGITCVIAGGQKVGIVGRTGSGKSTLTSVLFRLVEPSEGQVLIDDLDICTIGLHDLRSKLSIISQEPTLFKGSIRFNLDPFCQNLDAAIWEVLARCRLDVEVSSKGGLDATVGEDGDNWSLGQRQLFCLARALLKKSQILVLDEATASIDNATDALLQQTIREQFAVCTVITVAHRIPTVINCDMVMALSDGIMVEYDQPATLLRNKSSLFSKLVYEYWAHSHRV